IKLLATVFPSIENVGTLFDRSCTDEEGFSEKENRPACIKETVNRLSGLHASKSQALSSAAWIVAIIGTTHDGRHSIDGLVYTIQPQSIVIVGPTFSGTIRI